MVNAELLELATSSLANANGIVIPLLLTSLVNSYNTPAQFPPTPPALISTNTNAELTPVTVAQQNATETVPSQPTLLEPELALLPLPPQP